MTQSAPPVDALELKRDDEPKKGRWLIAGYDPGNLHNRMIFDGERNDARRKSMFQSYVLTLPKDTDPGLGFKIVKDGSARDAWTGVHYSVGDEALALNDFAGKRVLDEVYHKYTLALPCVVAHLWDVLMPTSTVVKLVVTTPNKAVQEAEFIAHLQGRHIVSRNGVEKTFSIEVVKVYTEGQGVIRVGFERKWIKSPGNLLFDIGNGTFIFSEFNRYTQLNPIPLQDRGVKDFLTQLVSDEEFNVLTKGVVRFEDLIQMFEDTKIVKGHPRYSLTVQNSDIDVTELVNDRAASWIRQCLVSAKRLKGSQFNSNLGKIATGGGCLIAPVNKALVDAGFKITENPIWDNVEGCYLMACVELERPPSPTVQQLKEKAEKEAAEEEAKRIAAMSPAELEAHNQQIARLEAERLKVLEDKRQRRAEAAKAKPATEEVKSDAQAL